MIENIKLKSTDPFNKEIKVINFGRVNTIIGPKGGGKSTLFDLVANLKNHVILSTTRETLAAHHLELSSFRIDGEDVPASALEVKKVKSLKDKNENYAKRNDVIYQADPIKEDLASSDSFEKDKMDFAKEIVSDAKDKDVVNIISKIDRLQRSISKVISKDRDTINWSSAFEVTKSAKSKYALLFQAQYNAKSDLDVLEKEKKQLKELWDRFTENRNFYTRTINTFSVNNFQYVEQEFTAEMVKNLNNANKVLDEIMRTIDTKIGALEKVHSLFRFFDAAYEQTIAGIKSKEKQTETVNSYISKSKNHMQEMGELLVAANKCFDDFVNTPVNIETSDKKEIENHLELAVNQKIELELEHKLDLLKRVLYTPKSALTEAGEWILVNKEKSTSAEKEFDPEKIYTYIASKIIKDSIKVLADGKDYQTMSLGERSIYGIMYKFNRSKDQEIFLDQPEDNLDNKTIATSIIDLIRTKGQQVFIVTHNANIGLLTNPDKVIVAQLLDQDKATSNVFEQYLEGELSEKRNGKSDSAIYLEGGVEFIQERLLIIRGEKHGINN